MNDHLTRALEKQSKEMAGPTPVELHILLLKLKEALENAPEFGDKPILEAGTPQRQWLAEVGALLSKLGFEKSILFKASFGTLAQYWAPAITQIKGQVLDAVEEIKLDLELDGRADIGNAYAPGEVYKFFKDLKAVINSAEGEILIVDPYFNGEAFDAYLANTQAPLSIGILADRYSKDINSYVKKHIAEYGSEIELRSSKELHDRIIFIDADSAWVMGGSIKDAGKKATYLIPLPTPLAMTKKAIYTEIWGRANKVE